MQYLADQCNFVIAGSGEFAGLAKIALKNMEYTDISCKRGGGTGNDFLIVGKSETISPGHCCKNVIELKK